MTRDDAADLALVGGIAALVGGVAWLLWPKDAAGASLAYAPAATPQEVAVSRVPMPAFLAAAPPAGTARERYFEAAVDAPTFVRIPLGQGVEVAVSSDYVQAQGVRVPLWPSTAQRVADRFGAMLPTKRLVDEIWRHATVKVAPRSMQPRAGVSRDSNQLLAEHEALVNAQVAGRAGLVAGQKKDLLIGKTSSDHPDRMVIFGWHQLNGTPIQPPTYIHSARYGNDYSTGARLISRTAYVNGAPTPIESLFANPTYSALLNESGPLSANQLRSPAV